MTQQFMFMDRSELENRNFGLDLLRCTAILLVLSEHSLAAFLDSAVFIPVYYYFGVYGVDLFFVLSGFLIGSILVKINNTEKGVTWSAIGNFWIRRWFRTLPNYLLVLVIYLLISGSKYPHLLHQLPLYLFFLQFTYNYPQFYAISWSLAVEEWFYLLFPVVLLSVKRILSSDKLKVIVLTCVLFIVGCLTLRIVFTVYGHPTWDDGIRKRTPLRLDSIATGVVMAIVKFYYGDFFQRQKKMLAIIGLILLAINSFVFYRNIIGMDALYGSFFMNTFFFTLSSIALALLLPYGFFIEVKGMLTRYVVTYISLISYSIYLFHVVVRDIMLDLFPGKMTIAHGILLLIVMWVITFFVSHFNYNLFEKKVTHLRDKFGKKKDVVHVLTK